MRLASMTKFIYWCMVFTIVAGAVMAGVDLSTSMVVGTEKQREQATDGASAAIPVQNIARFWLPRGDFLAIIGQ